MRSGFAPGDGTSFVAETRTVRLPDAVSYWTISCPPLISAEGSTVVNCAPSCSQRAGPKGAGANSCLLKMRSSAEVSWGDCAKAACTENETSKVVLKRRIFFTFELVILSFFAL